MDNATIRNRRSIEKGINSMKIIEKSLTHQRNERFKRLKSHKLEDSNDLETDRSVSEEKEIYSTQIIQNGSMNHEKFVKSSTISEDLSISDDEDATEECENFVINVKFDLITGLLFILAFFTRIYKLATPNNIVFDELHYGKYASLYMQNVFFFDQHPPLGKQLIAGLAHMTGFDGNFTFSKIGAEYSPNVPIFWLRFVPALCGSFLSPVVYKLLLEAKLNRWAAVLGGFLIIFDNSLLTQSRFILMESMLLFFSSTGLLFLLRLQTSKFISFQWIANGVISAFFFTFAISVKYVGFYSYCLGSLIMMRFLWKLLPNRTVTDIQILLQTICRWLIFTIIPIAVYLIIFYIHLSALHKAGPHDSVMTSAFQASLDGGLASITKGQPLTVVHGSQITLRHTHGRTCWLHSHLAVYPVRYTDKRGSSHQQQVTCYSFKDVNNWWIIKRPDRDDLVVGDEPEPIKHGDVIQLVHGITSRALNTHDVAAPMTPQAQEISCYIDYNVSMPAQLLWKVEIVNRAHEGSVWHAIRSEIRLIHEKTNTALRFTGRQLPDWGFNQHEVVADKNLNLQDSIWNVEEHRYTKTEDQKERERQMITAEMIPTKPTSLSFWEKFLELQMKMFWHSDPIQTHMYSSEPLEWPLMSKGIAYWIDRRSNAQIHLLGNIVIWYSGSFAIFLYISLLVCYLLRRRRLCYDLNPREWKKFQFSGEIFLGGYLIHYLPYFFIERTLFLHNYLPAFLFKILLLCYVLEHLHFILKNLWKSSVALIIYKMALAVWFTSVLYVFMKFLAVSYGMTKLTAEDVVSLRWKDTWDFILHKNLS